MSTNHEPWNLSSTVQHKQDISPRLDSQMAIPQMSPTLEPRVGAPTLAVKTPTQALMNNNVCL